MDQKLILITGSPCVGKTTVGKILHESYDNSAYLDGDWVWCVNPFSVEDPRLRNGDKNMSFVLSTYLNLKFEYIFFTSVITINHTIRNSILKDINAKGSYKIVIFHLTCSEKTLFNRHKERGDFNEISYHWLRLTPLSGDIVINTDDKSANQISQEIMEILNERI